jgi:enoyl-CoA hydratase/carnithine racemase
MSIRSYVSEGVATLELARPEKKNALTLEMYAQLSEGLKQAQQSATVRTVLITGQPGIFCAGNDLEDFVQRPPQNQDSPVFEFMLALVRCEKPVIVAVTGPAIGIGATLLLHSDLVYLSDEAWLSMPFVTLGLVPEFASSLLLPRLMGPRKAAEKLLLGYPVSAEEAVEFGLANAVLPASEVLPHARRMAERFNQLPPASVRQTKRLLRRADEASVLETLKQENQAFIERLASEEAKEAFSAFFQKRPADFAQFN